MAVTSSTNLNVQIAITLEEGFRNAVPEYFEWGTDSKLHHDPRKVNVFAHKKFSAEKNLFADSCGEVLRFDTPQEFSSIKKRLLTNPIYLQVRLEREKSSGNTRYITHGSFIVFINTQHPSINYQLKERLDEMELLINQGQNVAFEISFNRTLKQWFKSNFEESWASFSSENSNFCITNYSQRYHDCYNPLIWLVCFPCCLLGAPCYCIHRKVNCIDLSVSVHGLVHYTQGVSQEDREELIEILARAYSAGLSAGNNVVTQEQTYVTSPPLHPSSEFEVPKIV